MLKCRYCGVENVDQAITCKRCKAELPHDKKIPESTKENGAENNSTNRSGDNSPRANKRRVKE